MARLVEHAVKKIERHKAHQKYRTQQLRPATPVPNDSSVDEDRAVERIEEERVKECRTEHSPKRPNEHETIEEGRILEWLEGQGALKTRTDSSPEKPVQDDTAEEVAEEHATAENDSENLATEDDAQVGTKVETVMIDAEEVPDDEPPIVQATKAAEENSTVLDSSELPEMPQASEPAMPQVSEPEMPQVSEPAMPQVSEPVMPQVSEEPPYLEMEVEKPEVKSDPQAEKDKKNNSIEGDKTPRSKTSQRKVDSARKLKVDRRRIRKNRRRVVVPDDDDDSASDDSFISMDRPDAMTHTFDKFMGYIDPLDDDGSDATSESGHGTSFSSFFNEPKSQKRMILNEMQDLFMERVGCAMRPNRSRDLSTSHTGLSTSLSTSIGTLSHSFEDDSVALTFITEPTEEKDETFDGEVTPTSQVKVNESPKHVHQDELPKEDGNGGDNFTKPSFDCNVMGEAQSVLDDILGPLGMKTQNVDSNDSQRGQTGKTGIEAALEKLYEAENQNVAKSDFSISGLSKSSKSFSYISTFLPSVHEDPSKSEGVQEGCDEKKASNDIGMDTLMGRFFSAMQSKNDDAGESSIIANPAGGIEESRYSSAATITESFSWAVDMDASKETGAMFKSVKENFVKFKEKHFQNMNSSTLVEEVQTAMIGISVSQVDQERIISHFKSVLSFESPEQNDRKEHKEDEVHESSVEQSLEESTTIITGNVKQEDDCRSKLESSFFKEENESPENVENPTETDTHESACEKKNELSNGITSRSLPTTTNEGSSVCEPEKAGVVLETQETDPKLYSGKTANNSPSFKTSKGKLRRLAKSVRPFWNNKKSKETLKTESRSILASDSFNDEVQPDDLQTFDPRPVDATQVSVEDAGSVANSTTNDEIEAGCPMDPSQSAKAKRQAWRKKKVATNLVEDESSVAKMNEFDIIMTAQACQAWRNKKVATNPVEDESSFAKMNEFDIIMSTQACDDWVHMSESSPQKASESAQGYSGSSLKRQSTSSESNEREDVSEMEEPDWTPNFAEWDEESDPSTCISTPTSSPPRDFAQASEQEQTPGKKLKGRAFRTPEKVGNSPNCTHSASSPLDFEIKPIGSDWCAGESPSHVANFPGDSATTASF